MDLAETMVEPWLYPALAVIAVISGFVDAVAGGGALIAIPALLYAGVPPLQALGTNKLQSLFGNAAALANFRRAGMLAWRDNRLAVLAALAGGGLGAWAVQRIEPGLLKLIIPVLLIGAALYILISPRMSDDDAQHRLSDRGFAPVSGGIGFYDGFFGPGASTFFAASLVSLRGFGLTRATALTKLLNLGAIAASLAMFAIGGQVMWLLGLSMAAGCMAGAWLGSHSALKFGARLIRPLLVAISLALTVRLLWAQFAG